MQEGVGSETTLFGGGGGKGGNLKVVQRLWLHPQYGPVLQIPGESNTGSRWWLVGGDLKHDEDAGGLAENVKYPEKGGGKATVVWVFL